MATFNFQLVGEQFIKFYYDKFSSNREELLSLYRNESMLSWEGKKISGAAEIIKRFQELPPLVKFNLVAADMQPTLNEGVIIIVTGDVSIESAPFMKFSHVSSREGFAAYCGPVQLCVTPACVGYCVCQTFHLQKGSTASYFGRAWWP